MRLHRSVASLASLALSGLASTCANAQLDLTVGGIASPLDFSDRYALVSPSPQNVTFAPDPTGTGRTVLLMSVNETDERVFGGLRAQVSVRNEYIKEGVRWYGFSFYILPNWVASPTSTILVQISTSQKTAVLQPPLTVVARGTDLFLESHSNTRAVDALDGATKSNSAERITKLGPIRKGQWTCLVVNADWSHQPLAGSIKVWMNGAVVFEEANEPNSYETWLGNNPRVGLYAPGSLGTATRALYADFIWLGGTTTRFEDIHDRTPCKR